MMTDLIRMSMFCDMGGESCTSYAFHGTLGQPINNLTDTNFERFSEENEYFPKFATYNMDSCTAHSLREKNEQCLLQQYSFPNTVSCSQHYSCTDPVSAGSHNTLSGSNQYCFKDTALSYQQHGLTDTVISIQISSSTNTASSEQLSSCIHASASVQPPRHTDTVSSCSDSAVSSIVQRPSCTGTVPSIQTCMEFWTRIMLASKVDISTFKSVSPCAVFGNDYLHSIVTETTKQKLKHCLKNTICTDQSETKLEDKKKVERAVKCPIPYKYTALAIAAVYTSGKKSMIPSAIVNRINTLFPESTDIPQSVRKCMYKNIKKNKCFERHEDGTYSIVPGKVYLSTFCRKPSSLDNEQSMSQKYATLIHDHLGVPNMLTDLGFQVVTTKQTKVQIRDDKAYKKSGSKDGINNTTDIPCEHSQTVKRKCDEVDFEPNKRQCLELPVRPCFHDDSSDHEDDELLKLNDLPSSDLSKNYSQEKSSFTQQPVRDMIVCTMQPPQQMATITTPMQTYYLSLGGPV